MPHPSEHPVPPDVWATGDAYEAFIGRWSRRVARTFLAWLGVPADAAWLDVGCGTGALAATILETSRPRSVTGVDPSDGFVAHAHRAIPDARVSFHVGDARSLPVADGSFDAVVSGLALNFVPEPDRAVAEMARSCRPGGVVAAYVWDYAGRMEMLRRFWDAAVALDPSAAPLDEGPRFPLCREGALADLFSRAPLRDVATRAIDVTTRFRSFDDYWAPFLGGQGPAPTYVASLEAEAREALRERLRRSLPANPDGSIRLTARAWAARGVRA
ncbi:MAG TPA: class I SAM-dependent methyltransferase [Candidatus Eisenbacteria bacterium]